MNLYLIGAALVMILSFAAAEEIRIAELRRAVTSEAANAAKAQGELIAYRAEFTSELARRMLENAAKETERRRELVGVRENYEKRLAVLNARRLRADAGTARDGSPLSAAAGRDARAVDGAAESDRLPLVIRSDRRAELDRLLREAEVNTLKLQNCQDYNRAAHE